MEFEKQVAKEGFQSADAKFMGLSAEPIEGDSEKGHWRKAKTKWIIDGKEKENKFTIWSPMNSPKTEFKSDTELKQFERYRIIWVEKEENFDGKEWVEKKIVIITATDSEAPASTPTANAEPKPSVSVDLSNFNTFKDAYVAAIKLAEKEVDPVHMLGSYIATYEAERVAKLLELCKGVTND